MTSLQAANLPMIDFLKIIGPKTSDNPATLEASAKEKHALYRALKDVGFAYLKHPGLSDSEVQMLFEHAKRFFSKPESEKLELLGRMDRGRGPSQGWSSPVNRAVNTKVSDQKEFFGFYMDDDHERPNQWPRDWPEFRRAMNTFFENGHQVLLELLHALVEEIGLDSGTLEGCISEKNHFVALLHYPETTADSFKSRVRSATHTDYGCLTLLFNDAGEGLQVCDAQGEFRYAPPVPGCAIINVGDLLSRLFNGELASTKHRVIEPPAAQRTDDLTVDTTKIPARYSIAFFGHFNPSLVIKPLEACITRDRPARFEPVVAGEHVMARVRQLHTAGHSITVEPAEKAVSLV
ncbi:MAG: hypothetical protein M1816_000402 [Peltula sp. TS41687]|nr:MAG: hypothetical protein M1816_000402 [Peltula sp. TS41687]